MIYVCDIHGFFLYMALSNMQAKPVPSITIDCIIRSIFCSWEHTLTASLLKRAINATRPGLQMTLPSYTSLQMASCPWR